MTLAVLVGLAGAVTALAPIGTASASACDPFGALCGTDFSAVAGVQFSGEVGFDEFLLPPGHHQAVTATGWTCTTPVVGTYEGAVTCTVDPLAAGSQVPPASRSR
jgi:hypothetical protein